MKATRAMVRLMRAVEDVGARLDAIEERLDAIEVESVPEPDTGPKPAPLRRASKKKAEEKVEEAAE
ncbi:MAG: hypothetical protein JXA14_26035 [Anaerolineae bacterium]|nr:hypothetical protein [Anaerolineae bacterium]